MPRRTPAPGTLGGGFFIDNVAVDTPSAIIPEPATLLVWWLLAAAVGLGWRRRGKDS